MGGFHRLPFFLAMDIDRGLDKGYISLGAAILIQCVKDFKREAESVLSFLSSERAAIFMTFVDDDIPHDLLWQAFRDKLLEEQKQ